MTGRLQKLGIVLTVFGLLFFAGAAYAYIKVQDGQHSLVAFSTAQNVKLSYNDQGQLVDRGDVAESAAIRMTRRSTRPASTCTRWPPSRTTR
jgi:hypothetical protein